MERAEAFKTLRLDATADGALVESAYWQLVRKAQQRADEAVAQSEIDRLNQARDVLAPKGAPVAPVRKTPRRPESNARDVGTALLEVVADWVWAEALRIRLRWQGRNPEIAIVGGAAIVLMVLALGAGASAWGNVRGTGGVVNGDLGAVAPGVGCGQGRIGASRVAILPSAQTVVPSCTASVLSVPFLDRPPVSRQEKAGLEPSMP